MNYQKIILAGNAASDAQPRKSKKGDVTFTTFDVAVSDSKNRASFFPVMVFGRQGEVTADLVKKGCQVLVEGRVEISDGYVDIIADRVVLGSPIQQQQPRQNERDYREK